VCFGWYESGWYEFGWSLLGKGRMEAGLRFDPGSKGWRTSEGATTLRELNGERRWSGEMVFCGICGRRGLKSTAGKPWSPACMSYSATYGFAVLPGNAVGSLSNGLREMRRGGGRLFAYCSAMSWLRGGQKLLGG